MSAVLNAVRRSFYLDSVALMRLSRTIAGLPGVREAALMMGTPANRALMRDAGILTADGEAAQGNDLVIGVKAADEAAARAALAQAQAQLDAPRAKQEGPRGQVFHTLRAAAKSQPGSNLALISVPGDFAVAEARNALASGLNVLIFSDNVALADELALKREAQALGRLVMGPDCGTAIINGVPLAFANRVPKGAIGIVGASGTGMQEVSSLIAQAGGGISQAIGVGGRDLAREIGGISTRMAIDALDRDGATARIVLISKPPHPDVARAVLARVGASRKRFIVCFLGATGMALPPNATLAATLHEAAEQALGVTIGAGFAPALQARGGRIVGLYSGGTLGAEAQIILLAQGRSVASNAPVPGATPLGAATPAGDRIVDRIVDLGADEFTRGRPHPMIDPSVRDDMLRQAVADPAVGAILLDVVIGTGAHPDPAGHLAAILAAAAPTSPLLVASVTGTDDDAQVRARQVAILERAGIVVAPSNARAARLAAELCR